MSLVRRGAISDGVVTGPTEWTFDFPAPGITDQVDGSAIYILGTKFSVSEACTCTGIEWFSALTAPSDDMEFTLWNADLESVLETKVHTVHPVDDVGIELQVMFDAPEVLAPGTNYMATYRTIDSAPTRYTATSLYVWPQTDGPLIADASNGWYVAWHELVYPNNVSAFANNYHVGPIVEV